MNDSIRNILQRRSIRKFRPDQFPRAELEAIVQAGLFAPSARNRQPWHITVLRGLERIAALNAEVKAATARMPDNHYKAMVGASGYSINYHAPTFILVSGDPELSALAQVDCALVMQNMMLAACSLGLGSCWINQLGPLNGEAGFRQVLDKLQVPAQNRVYACLALGYVQGEQPPAPERKSGTVTYIGE
ncbi:nitroreductase [Desulfovibrio sp. OttesenSCG-928-A18]|nr:nitroreductase [Desulfovibrio sp. OttesenSCG-928-A18]